MAWLMTGLFMSRSVHLSYIARKIPGKSQKLSKVKMLSRLLDNRHIQSTQLVRTHCQKAAGNGGQS